jgi:hypothetical protein
LSGQIGQPITPVAEASVEEVIALCNERAHALEGHLRQVGASSSSSGVATTTVHPMRGISFSRRSFSSASPSASPSFTSVAPRPTSSFGAFFRMRSPQPRIGPVRDPIKGVSQDKWEEDKRNCSRCERLLGKRYCAPRHHCRACGKCVCAACSPHRWPVYGLTNPQRVCKVCVVESAFR